MTPCLVLCLQVIKVRWALWGPTYYSEDPLVDVLDNKSCVDVLCFLALLVTSLLLSTADVECVICARVVICDTTNDTVLLLLLHVLAGAFRGA